MASEIVMGRCCTATALLFFFINAPAAAATALKDDLQSISVTATLKRFIEVNLMHYFHRTGDLLRILTPSPEQIVTPCVVLVSIHQCIDNGQSLDRCCGAVTSAAADGTKTEWPWSRSTAETRRADM